MRVAPFRFSLQMSRINGRKAWLSDVAKAEDLGYDMLMTADHLTACAPPLVALTFAAHVTSVLRLGTLVLNNDLRHPCLLAREAAALDVLSDGRVEIGIGAGYAREEYARSGLRFDPAPVRISRLAESARLLRMLLDGEVVHSVGEHYQVRGDQLEHRPIQEHVPMLIGAGGRTALQAAAGIADTVGIASTGRDRRAEHVDRQVSWIRSAARKAHNTPEIQLLLNTVLVSPLRSDVDATLAARVPELSRQEADESPYVLIGSPATIAEKLMAAHARWGITHYTVRADAMASFGPVMALLRNQP
jgi:probable F420-dependent oxidoreductase